MIDPGAKQGNLVIGERLALAGRRHFGIFDEASSEMDDGAFCAVARDDVGAVFATFEGVFAGVEEKFAFGFFWIVAREAGFFEDGGDVFLELDLFGSGRRKFGDVN